MINRRNHDDVQEHLAQRRDVYRDSQGTQEARWSALRLLLLWADDRLLTDAPDLRPTFPAYLDAQRRAGAPLAYGTQQGFVSSAKIFFQWALSAHPRRYRRITPAWLDTLQAVKQPEGVKRHDAYTLDEVRAMINVPAPNLRARRIIAAVAFLFLSGMRIGAFVTLPLSAVDIARREVKQWTSLGVLTKFSKSATTYLLGIPDLLETVAAWDRDARAVLPDNAMWYPNLSETPGDKTLVAITEGTRQRAHGLRLDLQWLCAQAGLPYQTPHKLRHGHVVHALQNARTPADLKAISQNVMHTNLATTDGVYGILQDKDVSTRIARMGGAEKTSAANAALIEQLEALLAQLKGG